MARLIFVDERFQENCFNSGFYQYLFSSIRLKNQKNQEKSMGLAFEEKGKIETGTFQKFS